MPMPLEEYETLVSELSDPELTHERKYDILQTLRADYNTVVKDHTDLTTASETLKKENTDLAISNSKLFRSAGFINEEQKQKEDEKSFSETITIETILGGK